MKKENLKHNVKKTTYIFRANSPSDVTQPTKKKTFYDFFMSMITRD